MDLKLQGKTAIVTGGSRGIGKAIAEALLHEGVKVMIFDVDQPEEAAEIPSRKVDVSDWLAVEAGVREMAEGIFARVGGIDILVNNAAQFVLKPIEEATTDDWRRVLDTNVIGYPLLSICAQLRRIRPGILILGLFV